MVEWVLEWAVDLVLVLAAVHPDWEQVRRLYQNDEIIDLHVTGFNRGGLLVAGDGNISVRVGPNRLIA